MKVTKHDSATEMIKLTEKGCNSTALVFEVKIAAFI